MCCINRLQRSSILRPESGALLWVCNSKTTLKISVSNDLFWRLEQNLWNAIGHVTRLSNCKSARNQQIISCCGRRMPRTIAGELCWYIAHANGWQSVSDWVIVKRQVRHTIGTRYSSPHCCDSRSCWWLKGTPLKYTNIPETAWGIFFFQI